MKLTTCILLGAMLFAIAGCGGGKSIGIRVIEQKPDTPPCWYVKGTCRGCISLPADHLCIIGRGTQHETREQAEAQAKLNAADQVVSYVCGDLVDGQIDEIVQSGVGNQLDLRTIDIARTVVTIGETAGGVIQAETYWRQYIMTNEPNNILYDTWVVYDVNTMAYADLLAEQLQKEAQQRAGVLREKLEERANRLREGRWRPGSN